MEIWFQLCDTVVMSRESVGSFIRRQRLAAHLTQQELADAIQMTNRSISEWETGRAIPGREALRRLARVFQVGLDELNSYLTDDQLAKIDSIVETTQPDELSVILEEIRAEGQDRPDIAQSLRDWLAGWRARGAGAQPRR